MGPPSLVPRLPTFFSSGCLGRPGYKARAHPPLAYTVISLYVVAVCHTDTTTHYSTVVVMMSSTAIICYNIYRQREPGSI